MRGHAEDVQVAVADFEYEQDVEPPQRHRAVDLEEVDGQHAGGLGAQELQPTRIGVSRWRRWDPVALQDPTDRRGADAVTEFEQLALDPAVPPARVLPRHTLYQRGEDVVDRWPSGPVRVGPSPAYEVAVPAQDGARGDQAVAPQVLGQPPGEGGEDRPVGPVEAWSRVGARPRSLPAPPNDLPSRRADLTATRAPPAPDTTQRSGEGHPVGFHNLAVACDQRFQAAGCSR